MESAIGKILRALEQLGVKGKIWVYPIRPGRMMVIVNRKSFGIYDLSRDTFVD